MNFPFELRIDQIQSVILGTLFWAWIFLWAPSRAMRVGIALDDPPLGLKMQPFKLIRFLGLIGALYVAYAMAPEWNLSEIDYAGLLSQLATGQQLAPLLAIGLTLLLLFILPEMTARGRLRQNEPVGEWLTPALVYFRWTWLAVATMASMTIHQNIPLLSDLLGVPLNEFSGAGIPLAGALFFLLWWGWPAMRVARLAESEMPQAIGALSRVRWLGLPAYLRFALGARGGQVERKPGARKLCPSCMRPTDNVEQYESLRFDNCPHCKELIPPAFGIEDYIKHYAEKVRALGMSKAGGKRQTLRGKQESDLVQRILRAMFTQAVRERGTDLHMVNESARCIVRCRADGVLFTMVDLPEELLRPLISAIKVASNMDISERRRPQDGSFKTMVDEVKLDLRVNTSPAGGGETASLRLLYRQTVLGSLEKLGLGRRNYQILQESITHPHGMILVTGPTGSGKSTTLYNALGHLADGKKNIITLEDPIEFKIEGLTQMQIEPSKDFTFTTGLRTILRQDPDVIMIGEIRDPETAKMAIDAAMTGHLVFSTLHTIDTSTTIGRLSDLGVDPHRHADALVMIVAQRLLRLNCEACAEEVTITPEQLEAMGLPRAPNLFKGKRGKGCERCHTTGFHGREGIFELFAPDERLRASIGERLPPAQIRNEARARGMRTLLEDGLTRVMLGRTTVEEVLRVTN
jgi:type II secretory ATPase GspE/PulE/Tfp pilus assembly ATPase PilB-like protein